MIPMSLCDLTSLSLECKINYRNNFYVKSGKRYYYEGIPDTLQIGEHQFAERRLIEHFIALMGTSW